MVLHALGFEDILRKFIFIYFSTFPGKDSNMLFVNEKTDEIIRAANPELGQRTSPFLVCCLFQ